MKFLYWLTRNSLKVIFLIFYRHKVYGKEHLFKGKAIIAPNHSSFFDPPLIAVSMPEEVSFLARKTLFHSPIFGALIRNLNAYPVTGTTQDLNSFKLIYRLLDENKKVVIFPEGVRSSDGNLVPIKPGIGMIAIRSRAPVIPIYIFGSFDVWNRSRRFPKLFGKTACVIGSPINWQEFDHLERKEAHEALAAEVKRSLERLKDWYANGAVGLPP